MSYVKGLRCRECGAETPVAPLHVCEICFGPLEVVYDYAAIRRVLTHEAIAANVIATCGLRVCSTKKVQRHWQNICKQLRELLGSDPRESP